MRRSELEHVLRAASAVTLHREFIVIGSQAILGSYPHAPADLLSSMEVDIYPKNKPEDSILIDAAIGERSTFHDTFGYYAHGVGPETASLPQGWEDRLVPIQSEQTHDSIGWCLEPHDLAVSKLIAGRDKDLDYARGLLKHRLVDATTLAGRIETAAIDNASLDLCRQRLRKLRRETAGPEMLEP